MAIAFDAITKNAYTAGTANPAFTHTITGANPVLFVVAGGVSGAIGSVTWNGTAMTLRVNSGVNVRTYIYSFTAPSTGLGTVQVFFSSAAGRIDAMSYTGVDQTTPVDVVGSFNTSGTFSAGTITTTIDNDWIIDVVSENNASSIGSASGQTNRDYGTTQALVTAQSDLTTTTAGAYVSRWNGVSLARGYDQCMLGFKSDAVAPPATNRTYMSLTGAGNI